MAAFAADYVIDEHVLVRGVLEATYATDPTTGYITVPVFRQTTPQQIMSDAIDLGQLTGDLSPNRSSFARYRSEQTYEVFGYNSAGASLSAVTQAPPWAQLFLPACGFNDAVVTGSAPSTGTPTLTPSNGAGSMSNGGYYAYKFVKVDDDITASTYRNWTASTSGFEADLTTSGHDTVTATGLTAAGAGYKYYVFRTKTYASTGAPSALTSYFFHSVLDADDTGFVDTKSDYELDQTRNPLAAGDRIMYSPMDERISALTMLPYVQGHLRKAVGCRGSFTTNWTAGDPTTWTFNFMGIKQNATATAIPTGYYTDAGIPPNWCGTAPVLTPRSSTSSFFTDLGNGAGSSTAGASITPFAIKSVSFNLNRPVILRRDAGATCSVREFILGRAASTVDITFEVDRDFQFDPIRDKENGVTYGLGNLIVGSTQYSKYGMSFPNLAYASDPVLAAEDQQIKVWNASFSPTILSDPGDWCNIFMA